MQDARLLAVTTLRSGADRNGREFYTNLRNGTDTKYEYSAHALVNLQGNINL